MARKLLEVAAEVPGLGGSRVSLLESGLTLVSIIKPDSRRDTNSRLMVKCGQPMNCEPSVSRFYASQDVKLAHLLQCFSCVSASSFFSFWIALVTSDLNIG